MAAHAGVLYSDSRPVPSAILDLLARGNADLGPDTCGSFITDGLAILSFAEHFDRFSSEEQQPIHTPDGAVLTWDGRLDNREEFLIRLHAEVADDCTDARLVATAAHKWHDDTLAMAIGDWSLVRWDRRQRELMLARDYAGNRPLYYCSRPGLFVWSTALGPLAEVCGVAGRINDAYFARYLTLLPVETHTPYVGIFAVPPGASVRLRPDHDPVATSFTRFGGRTIRYRDRSLYQEQYRDLLTQAVKVRLRTHGPVWTELSGGYDSSAITCVANSLIRAKHVEAPQLQPVSYVSPDSPESDESRYIAAVEEHCGLRSIRMATAGGLRLDSLSTAQPDSKHVASYSFQTLAKAAGSHVLLSGEFGDAVTMPIDGPDLLSEHLRHFQLRSFFVDGLQYCRVRRTPFVGLLTSLAATKLMSQSSQRRSFITSVAAARRVASDDLATVFGLRSDFLKRTPIPHSTSIRAVVAASAAGANLVRTFDDYVMRNVFSMRSSSVLHSTYPYTHKPLLDFMLSVPLADLWSVEHPRAFVCAALSDVLPNAVLTRGHKGYAPPAVARSLIPTVESSLPEIDRWRLVECGYADPFLLKDIFHGLLNGSQTSIIVVSCLIDAEKLLRRLTSTGMSNATDQENLAHSH